MLQKKSFRLESERFQSYTRSAMESLVPTVSANDAETSHAASARPITALAFRFFLTSAAIVFAGVTVQMLLRSPFWEFSAGRLAPLIGLKYGYHLYYPPGEGPLFVTQYGPVAFLAYAPSLLAHTPIGAILTAVACAMGYIFGPIILLSWQAIRRDGTQAGSWVIAALIFGFYTLQSDVMSYAAFTVHSDAPALGFGAAACVVLFGRSENSSQRSLVLAALLVVLATWAKPTAFPGIVVAVLYLWVTENRHKAIDYLKWVVIVGLAVTILFLGIFGPRALIFNVFSLTGKLPFLKTSWGAGGAIFWQSPLLLKECAIPMAILGFIGLETWPIIRTTFLNKVKLSLRSNRWSIFALTAVAMFPVSLTHKALVGADVNALDDTLYYFLLAAVTAMGEVRETSVRRLAGVSLAVLALISAPSLAHIATDVRQYKLNPRRQAFDFARRHPHEVYFPLDPLATLYADGRLYHYDVALFDADMLKLSISERQFRDYLPSQLEFVAYEAHNQYSRKLFPDFHPAGPVAELPGWNVYSRSLVTKTRAANGSQGADAAFKR